MVVAVLVCEGGWEQRWSPSFSVKPTSQTQPRSPNSRTPTRRNPAAMKPAARTHRLHGLQRGAALPSAAAAGAGGSGSGLGSGGSMLCGSGSLALALGSPVGGERPSGQVRAALSPQAPQRQRQEGHWVSVTATRESSPLPVTGPQDGTSGNNQRNPGSHSCLTQRQPGLPTGTGSPPEPLFLRTQAKGRRDTQVHVWLPLPPTSTVGFGLVLFV